MPSPNALQIFQGLREDLASDQLAALRAEVKDHYQRLVEAQKQSELIAVDLAEALCTRLDALLGMAHLMDSEARQNIVGAARYFVSSADARPDDQSCTGLDDDVDVFNQVARLLGRGDLAIDD